ncbi:MAG: hypothetical protein AM324_014020 [Candidatus Thorarchaeota archaeon SMTZ1-83]
MKVCSKCNKANLPTRKYCIRCGNTLVTPPKKRAEPTPQAPVSEAPAVETPTPSPAEGARVTTDDRWVRPSEVAKDRMRTASGGRRKSELEKAREAFARAEEVGIEEEGTGVIETRMLRASEVRELLEASGGMEAEAPLPEAPAPTMMEGSEPLPPEAAELMTPAVPRPEQVEEQFLGTKSGFVTPGGKPPPTLGASPDRHIDAASAPTPAIQQDAPSPIASTPPTVPVVKAETVTSAEVPAAPEVVSPRIETDSITICQKCGEAINIDLFEYPAEVYSAMGSARLKQARYLVVQGKSDDARRIVRIARGLFAKANDETGLSETQRLIDSLAKGG